MHGKGKLVTFTYTYEGDFDHGKFKGNGRMEFVDKETYTGSFDDNKKHGAGLLEYPNGNRYEGEFKNGKKEGLGQMDWEDHLYKGQWEKDEIQGFGTYVWIEK